MLEVELDIFSGMPNPVWSLSPQQEKGLYDRLTADQTQISPVHTPNELFSLGYRGLIVRRIKMDGGPWDRAILRRRKPFPNEFRIGSKPGKHASIAAWLLKTSERRGSAVTDDLREVAARGVALVETSRAAADPARRFTLRKAPADAQPGVHVPSKRKHRRALGERGGTWWDCPANHFSANAGYFNDPAHVARNNCYAFASNHLADVRYALPGRRGGSPATSITCGGVTAGLFADGWKVACQPNGITIAMVIWPNYDYHFYRLVTDTPYWWWGHKPGGTPAKYTDDCGNPIYQYNGVGWAPNNICRGNYVDLCGYFYQDNNTAYVA